MPPWGRHGWTLAVFQMDRARTFTGTALLVSLKPKYHAKCPQTMCYTKDSIGHLLEFCPLQQEVQFFAHAAPF